MSNLKLKQTQLGSNKTSISGRNRFLTAQNRPILGSIKRTTTTLEKKIHMGFLKLSSGQ